MNFIQPLSPYQPFLWLLSTIGFFGLNGIFIHYTFWHPEVLAAAQQNPVSLVFMAEAFVMVAFGAWIISRFELEQPGWIAFVGLSLLGGLAFSVPFFLLLHLRNHQTPEPASDELDSEGSPASLAE